MHLVVWFMQERFPSLVHRVCLAVLLTDSPLTDVKSKDSMRKPAAHDWMSHCPGGLRVAWKETRTRNKCHETEQDQRESAAEHKMQQFLIHFTYQKSLCFHWSVAFEVQRQVWDHVSVKGPQCQWARGHSISRVYLETAVCFTDNRYCHVEPALPPSCCPNTDPLSGSEMRDLWVL